MGEKRLNVVREREAKRRVVDVERLNEHAAFSIGAAGASGDLDDEWKRAFGGAEVGARETLVGEENADERDAREVVPLRDHARSDEDVGFMARKAAEGVVERGRRANGVAVEADDAGRGESRGERRFDFFDADADKRELRGAANRARHGDLANIAARVSKELVSRTVVNERDFAAVAADDVAARLANDGRR